MTGWPDIRPFSYAELEAEEFDFNYPFQYQMIGAERGVVLGAPGRGVVFLGEVHGCEWDIIYLYVSPEHRGQGWSRRLLDAALAFSEGQGRTCWMTVYFNCDYAEGFLRRYAAEKGMLIGIRTIISQVLLQPLREHLADELHRMLARMNVWREVWERRGAVTCSYEAMPEAVRQRLQEEWRQTDLEKRQLSADIPPFPSDYDETLSVVTYLGDEPLAYLTTLRRGDAAILSGHVCLLRYRKTGAAYLTLLRFFDLVRQDTTLRQVTYKILERNRLPYLQAEHFWKYMNPKITEMRSFCYEVAQEPAEPDKKENPA